MASIQPSSTGLTPFLDWATLVDEKNAQPVSLRKGRVLLTVTTGNVLKPIDERRLWIWEKVWIRIQGLFDRTQYSLKKIAETVQKELTRASPLNHHHKQIAHAVALLNEKIDRFNKKQGARRSSIPRLHMPEQTVANFAKKRPSYHDLFGDPEKVHWFHGTSSLALRPSQSGEIVFLPPSKLLDQKVAPLSDGIPFDEDDLFSPCPGHLAGVSISNYPMAQKSAFNAAIFPKDFEKTTCQQIEECLDIINQGVRTFGVFTRLAVLIFRLRQWDEELYQDRFVHTTKLQQPLSSAVAVWTNRSATLEKALQSNVFNVTNLFPIAQKLLPQLDKSFFSSFSTKNCRELSQNLSEASLLKGPLEEAVISILFIKRDHPSFFKGRLSETNKILHRYNAFVTKVHNRLAVSIRDRPLPNCLSQEQKHEIQSSPPFPLIIASKGQQLQMEVPRTSIDSTQEMFLSTHPRLGKEINLLIVSEQNVETTKAFLQRHALENSVEVIPDARLHKQVAFVPPPLNKADSCPHFPKGFVTQQQPLPPTPRPRSRSIHLEHVPTAVPQLTLPPSNALVGRRRGRSISSSSGWQGMPHSTSPHATSEGQKKSSRMTPH